MKRNEHKTLTNKCILSYNCLSERCFWCFHNDYTTLKPHLCRHYSARPCILTHCYSLASHHDVDNNYGDFSSEKLIFHLMSHCRNQLNHQSLSDYNFHCCIYQEQLNCLVILGLLAASLCSHRHSQLTRFVSAAISTSTAWARARLDDELLTFETVNSWEWRQEDELWICHIPLHLDSLGI